MSTLWVCSAKFVTDLFVVVHKDVPSALYKSEWCDTRSNRGVVTGGTRAGEGQTAQSPFPKLPGSLFMLFRTVLSRLLATGITWAVDWQE